MVCRGVREGDVIEKKKGRKKNCVLPPLLFLFGQTTQNKQTPLSFGLCTCLASMQHPILSRTQEPAARQEAHGWRRCVTNDLIILNCSPPCMQVCSRW